MSVANIRKDINQSQREGKLFYSSFYFVSHGFILGVHSAPPGRVVGMLNTGGPFIPPHQSYQAYFSGRTAAMLPPPFQQPVILLSIPCTMKHARTGLHWLAVAHPLISLLRECSCWHSRHLMRHFLARENRNVDLRLVMCGLRLGLKARAWASKPGLRPNDITSRAQSPQEGLARPGLGLSPGFGHVCRASC